MVKNSGAKLQKALEKLETENNEKMTKLQEILRDKEQIQNLRKLQDELHENQEQLNNQQVALEKTVNALKGKLAEMDHGTIKQEVNSEAATKEVISDVKKLEGEQSKFLESAGDALKKIRDDVEKANKTSSFQIAELNEKHKALSKQFTELMNEHKQTKEASELRADSSAKTDVIQLLEIKTNSLQDQINKHREETKPILDDLGIDIAGLLLAVKKLETQQSMQESNIKSLQDMSATMQPSDAGESQSPKKAVSTDQLKRLLALIENNAQANALQRETTMNVLLRLELLEKNTNTNNLGNGKGSTLELPNVYSR